MGASRKPNAETAAAMLEARRMGEIRILDRQAPEGTVVPLPSPGTGGPGGGGSARRKGGWRRFDGREEAASGKVLWLHRRGTEHARLARCDDAWRWHYEDTGVRVCAAGEQPDMCHDVQCPPLPQGGGD